MSLSRMVVFTTWEKPMPAATRIAFRLCITWFVSATISEISIFPVAGLMAIWPDMNSRLPVWIAWLYGPIGAGASAVVMIFFSIRKDRGYGGIFAASSIKDENCRNIPVLP